MKKITRTIPLPIAFGLIYLFKVYLMNGPDQDVRDHVVAVVSNPEYAKSFSSMEDMEDKQDFSREIEGVWQEKSDGITYKIVMSKDRTFTYSIKIDSTKPTKTQGRWAHVGNSSIIYLNNLEGDSHIITPKIQILTASFSSLTLYAPPVGILDLNRKNN